MPLPSLAHLLLATGVLAREPLPVIKASSRALVLALLPTPVVVPLLVLAGVPLPVVLGGARAFILALLPAPVIVASLDLGAVGVFLRGP